MEIGERYFRELLFETTASEAAFTKEPARMPDRCLRDVPDGVVPAGQADVQTAIDRFSGQQLDRLDALDKKVWSIRDVYEAILTYLRRHESDLLRRERGLTDR